MHDDRPHPAQILARRKTEPEEVGATLSTARRIDYRRYSLAAVVMAVTTGIVWAFHALGLTDADLVMPFMLGIVFIAARLGRGPAIFASVVAVLLFNFFFTPPFYTLAINETKYLFTFAVMLVIAVIISALTSRIRDQVELSRQRERRTEALYRLSRRLAGTSGRQQLVAAAEAQLCEIFGGEVAIFLPDSSHSAKTLCPALRRDRGFAESPTEVAVASWVYDRGQLAGAGTDTLPSAQALYLPLVSPEGTVGVLAVRPTDVERLLTTDQRQLLETFASQIALALTRDRFAEAAQHALTQIEAEKLRSALLSTVSHDLRTPLATIAGASSSLLTAKGLAAETRAELLQTIYDEAERLSRLVENLLSMTRIEAGSVKVNAQWQHIEEVIGTALSRLSRQLTEHPITTTIASDIPLVSFDGLLLEQVLVNLIDNAAQYSPPGTPIDISAWHDNSAVFVQVADRGPGLVAEEVERVFEKFYRGPQATAATSRGAGLGLAICRAIMQAHGGRIWAENRAGRGACFSCSLPLAASPPVVALDIPDTDMDQGAKADDR
jgi:two-component system sensor histidine kinase KdpD